MEFKRVFLIVCDSMGIGHAKDAEKFNDSKDANTLLNIDRKVGGIKAKFLANLGIGLYDNYILNSPHDFTKNSYVARLSEISNGKDTMTGHWEMMGVKTEIPFKTFTETGFPKELIKQLEDETGHKIIGNYAASGTEIIKVLGKQQMKENALIVYTSSDSVLQIAANEEVVPVEELYRCCEIARKITLKDEYKVGRIIARPFIGTEPSNFTRTPKRHDYALSPSTTTCLDILKENNLDVISVGKIADIFNNQGISEAYKGKSNKENMDIVIDLASKRDFKGLCFVNLVEFDSEYGHRRNVEGYAKCIEEFDEQLGQLLKVVKDDDLVIITADHGNDPTQPGSDHTRENVPCIMYSKSIVDGKYIGEFDNFGVMGVTILNNFKLTKNKDLVGENIL